LRERLTRSAIEHLAAGLTLVASSLVFHFPTWGRGLVPNEDDLEIFYFPLLVATADALKEGRLPLWTPGMFGGYPLFADGEAGMLYPFHLLTLSWLSPEASLAVLPVIDSVLAGVFTYALLRVLGVGAAAGVVSGIIYAYCGFVAGQAVHLNVYSALVWLPLELALIERAYRGGGWERCRWAVLAGATFGIQALAVHIHVTLLSALVVGAFLAYRALAVAASSRPHEPVIQRLRATLMRLPAAALWSAALVLTLGIVGVGLAAVQLLPLYELGARTARSQGLDPGYAAMNSLWPGDFLTLLLPRFFDSPGGDYWGLWVKWETTIYVGILPLLLAAVGMIRGRGNHRIFFVLLLPASLLAALGANAPFPLWDTLHELPAFDVLRSPGRFALTFSLSVAVLAGFGADWLARRSRRSFRTSALAALAAVVVPLVAAQGLRFAISTIQSVPESASVAARYLSLAGAPTMVEGTPLAPDRLLQIAAANLDPSSDTVRQQLGLLAAAGLCLALWLLRMPRLATPLTLSVIFVDLWTLALTLHPYRPIAELRPEVPPILLQESGAPFRVYTPPTTQERVAAVEPNRLLAAGLQEANGYSSLEPDRHLAYVRAVEYADNTLLDLWNARYVIRRNVPRLLPSYGLTSFHPERPLLNGSQGNPGSDGTFIPDGGDTRTDEVRLIGSLEGATTLPQGSVAARITLEGPNGERHSSDVRAGEHIADMRAGLGPHGADHRPVTPAFTYPAADPSYSAYQEQLSYGRLDVSPPMVVHRVSVENLLPTGRLRIFGIGLLDGSKGEVVQARTNDKYSLVFRNERISVFENAAAMPRAFLVDQWQLVPPDGDTIGIMVDGPFDPATTALLEAPLPRSVQLPEPPAPATASADPSAALVPNPRGRRYSARREVATPSIPTYRADEVRIDVAADRDSLLVLTDPFFVGWVAHVDDQETPILRADHLFRAVVVPAGEHQVVFRYQPVSVALGALLTLATSVLLFGLAAAHGAQRLLHRRRLPTGGDSLQ
jgi:hypothetical protein